MHKRRYKAISFAILAAALYAISSPLSKNPFIGVGLSFIVYFEIPTVTFIVALFIMIVGTYFASTEN